MIVVMANGVFDILHRGHLLYLEAGERMGDLLVVAVTMDKFVDKGPNRPTNSQDDRLALVKALRPVNHAQLVEGAIEGFEYYKPDIFVKGKDYRRKIEKRHRDYCKAHGIEIRFTNTPLYSATRIINDRIRHG